MSNITTKHRKNILRKVKVLIKQHEKEYGMLLDGSKEGVQDIYIKKVCEEMGFEFSHFYAEEGKKLEKLLSTL